MSFTLPFAYMTPLVEAGTTTGNDANTTHLFHCANTTNTGLAKVSGNDLVIANVANAGSTTKQKFTDGSILQYKANTQFYSPCSTSNLDFSQDFTIDFWYAATTARSSGGYWCEAEQRSTSKYAFRMKFYSTSWFIDIWNSAGTQIVDVRHYHSAAQGTMSHYAIVKKGTSFKIYVNGVVDYSVTIASMYSTGIDRIWYGGGGGIYSGNHDFFDEIRVSNVARWDAPFTPYTVPYY